MSSFHLECCCCCQFAIKISSRKVLSFLALRFVNGMLSVILNKIRHQFESLPSSWNDGNVIALQKIERKADFKKHVNEILFHNIDIPFYRVIHPFFDWTHHRLDIDNHHPVCVRLSHFILSLRLYMPSYKSMYTNSSIFLSKTTNSMNPLL